MNAKELAVRLDGDAALVLENPYSKFDFDEKPWNENLRYLIR